MSDYCVPEDYLDNTQGRLMEDALRYAALVMQQPKLDVTKGFFHPDVWSALCTALPQLQEFRLLLSKVSKLESPNTCPFDLHTHYRRKDLETLLFNPQYCSLIDGLELFYKGTYFPSPLDEQ